MPDWVIGARCDPARGYARLVFLSAEEWGEYRSSAGRAGAPGCVAVSRFDETTGIGHSDEITRLCAVGWPCTGDGVLTDEFADGDEPLIFGHALRCSSGRYVPFASGPTGENVAGRRCGDQGNAVAWRFGDYRWAKYNCVNSVWTNIAPSEAP